MQDNDFLAFQYAVGLLDKKQKQSIDRTKDFEKALLKWQIHLSKLTTQALLDKESTAVIWKNISKQTQSNLQSNKFGVVNTLLQYWRYILSSIASLGLIISLALSQTAHAQLGWDIDTNLEKQKIFITTTTHQHTDETTVCTLWVKKDSKVLRIGLMPETGKKTLDINQKVLAMLKNSEMIISFEKKGVPTPSAPTIIDYQEKWTI